MRTSKSPTRIEHGDWQTPLGLAREVLALVGRRGFRPASVLEPSCGTGAFLQAAIEAMPGIVARGFDIDPEHVAEARRRLDGRSVHVEIQDFFTARWETILGALPDPLLLVGNPPWVTSAALGALGGRNMPVKARTPGLHGLDARTGKSNFDVAEWMIGRLLPLLCGRAFLLAMLCKASVARRLMEQAARARWPITGATYRINARVHFQAAVDAVLLVIGPDPSASAEGSARWPVFEGLDAAAPSRSMGVVEGRVYSDMAGFERTRHLEGVCVPEWRSGVKHDCARVMELSLRGGALVNGLGDTVDVEPECVFPLLKGSDIVNGRPAGERFVVLPQRYLSEDTGELRERAPRTWAYLDRHRALLDARRSSIYRERPPFSVFGIGAYTFAPWKVAIGGLYKRIAFTLVEPHGERPVVLDDTCYFLPCAGREEGERIVAALNGEMARAFFAARAFWDEKRPIGKGLLQALSIEALLRDGGRP